MPSIAQQDYLIIPFRTGDNTIQILKSDAVKIKSDFLYFDVILIDERAGREYSITGRLLGKTDDGILYGTVGGSLIQEVEEVDSFE